MPCADAEEATFHPFSMLFNRFLIDFHGVRWVFPTDFESISADSACNEVLRLVSFGSQARSTAATMMNESSSRSHAIFSLRMERAQWSNRRPKHRRNARKTMENHPKSLENFMKIS